jgi:hypothetical protein
LSPPRPFPLNLILTGASFSGVTTILRLSFNEPVDVSGIFPGNFQVEDGASGKQWEGQGPVILINSWTVEIGMFEIQAQSYPDTRLNALEPTGIVAVDDAEAWAGVANLLLPSP